MKKTFYIFIFCFLFSLVFGQTTTETQTIAIVGGQPDVSAVYPGGLSALFKYINDNVTKNMSFTQDESYILRKALAKFTIDQNGYVDSVSIIKSSNIPRLDSLLTTSLKKMPKWTPASKDGKPVRQQYSFPLQICLK